jgi:hypothetical protein
MGEGAGREEREERRERRWTKGEDDGRLLVAVVAVGEEGVAGGKLQ